ncbi:MAG: recombinase family protein [Muribaculum sp.]|nr:recombinase family protein [Muribaculum sp.]
MTTNRTYVLWRRVSTKQQGETSLGLDAQQAIAEYFMQTEPVKVFTDVYSGTKLAECPNLQKAIKYCKGNNCLLVIAKTDRFRNVQQALAILDEVGEGNLCFCDLPTTDRTVLTIVFAIWERQAMMGRINTKRALAERKKQGAWVSKTGHVRTKLGRPAAYVDSDGKEHYDVSAMVEAASIKRMDELISWRESSLAYGWAIEQARKGKPRKVIVAEFNELHAKQPKVYCTHKGKPLTEAVLSKWLAMANPIAV